MSTPALPVGTNTTVTQFAGNANTNAYGNATPNGGTLTTSDFMNLLVAQLKNQDPTDPQSDQEFAAQMAQFSSLSQMTDMNKTLGTLSNVSQLSSGAGLIGATVQTNQKDNNGDLISGTVSSVTTNSSGAIAVDINGTDVPVTSITAVSPPNGSKSS